MTALPLPCDFWTGLAWVSAKPVHLAQAVDRGTAAAHSDAAMDERDAGDVEAVRRGDAGGYERIMRRHQDAIAGHLWRFTRRRDVLEELVQETFVRGYFSLRTWRGEAPLGHWLMRIATRVGYRHWQQRKLETAITLTPRDWESLAARAEPEEAHAALHELLDQLPPRDRLVLLLLHVEGYSVAEAAAHAGWSQTMVKVQAYRARRKLRAILQRSGAGVKTQRKESSS